MVVGHLAVGLSAKRLSRNTSLVWFITAANLVDLIWPLFLLIGLERVRIDPGKHGLHAARVRLLPVDA